MNTSATVTQENIWVRAAQFAPSVRDRRRDGRDRAFFGARARGSCRFFRRPSRARPRRSAAEPGHAHLVNVMPCSRTLGWPVRALVRGSISMLNDGYGKNSSTIAAVTSGEVSAVTSAVASNRCTFGGGNCGRPGSRLPSEAELCAFFQVNRGTVRRALEELSRSGQVVATRGHGTFVADHSRDVAILLIEPWRSAREFLESALPAKLENVAIEAAATLPVQFPHYDMAILSIHATPLDDPTVQHQLAALRRTSGDMKIVVMANDERPSIIQPQSINIGYSISRAGQRRPSNSRRPYGSC